MGENYFGDKMASGVSGQLLVSGFGVECDSGAEVASSANLCGQARPMDELCDEKNICGLGWDQVCQSGTWYQVSE